MVRAIYTDKRGIYKDLYRTIDSENKKEKPVKRQRKGIYTNLYMRLEEEKRGISQQVSSFKGNNRKDKARISLFVAFKNFVNVILSKASYFVAATAGEIKVIILAFLLVKKPINSYIENSLETSQEQN